MGGNSCSFSTFRGGATTVFHRGVKKTTGSKDAPSGCDVTKARLKKNRKSVNKAATAFLSDSGENPLPPLCRCLFHLQLLVPLLSVFLFHHFLFCIVLCSPQCLNRRELLCIIIQISLPEGKLLRSHHLSPLCSFASNMFCYLVILGSWLSLCFLR